MLIAVAGGLAALLGVILLIIRPIGGWRDDQISDLNRAESTYEMVAEASAIGGGATSARGGQDAQSPINSILSRTAAQASVNLTGYNPRPDGAVEASAAETDPAALFAWLGQLESEYGVRIDYADVLREQADPSLVRAQMTFSRPGSQSGAQPGGGV